MSKKKKKAVVVNQALERLTRMYKEFMESWRAETDWISQIERRSFSITDLLAGNIGFGSDDLGARLVYGAVSFHGDQDWSLFTAFGLNDERYWFCNSWSCRPPGLTLVNTTTGDDSFIRVTWTGDVATLEPKRLKGMDIVEITKGDVLLRDDDDEVTAVAHDELIAVLKCIGDAIGVTLEMMNLAREMIGEAA